MRRRSRKSCKPNNPPADGGEGGGRGTPPGFKGSNEAHQARPILPALDRIYQRQQPDTGAGSAEPNDDGSVETELSFNNGEGGTVIARRA